MRQQSIVSSNDFTFRKSLLKKVTAELIVAIANLLIEIKPYPLCNRCP